MTIVMNPRPRICSCHFLFRCLYRTAASHVAMPQHVHAKLAKRHHRLFKILYLLQLITGTTNLFQSLRQLSTQITKPQALCNPQAPTPKTPALNLKIMYRPQSPAEALPSLQSNPFLLVAKNRVWLTSA